MTTRASILWTFAITSLALFMVSLDNLVVTTAIPVIRVDLGASLEQLEWTVNAYTLTFAVLLQAGLEVAGQAWRMHKLDDLLLYAGAHRKVTALVARDRRLLRLELALPAAATTWRLVLRDPGRAQAWFANA